MTDAAFYTVCDDGYFLGAVGLVNSLRLVGHDEPIFLLDCGLTVEQRELLAPEVSLIDGPHDVPGNLLKTIAPLSHPAQAIVLIDADIVVTRRLDELIERGSRGEVLAFETGMDRFCPEWGEQLGLGAARPKPYLCSALVFCGGPLGEEIVRLIDTRRDAVDWELTYWRRNVADYPLVHADQDLFNAVLTTRVDDDRIVPLEGRLLAFPPFAGLSVAAADSLRCGYPDGVEPYAVHHWAAKPWLEPTHHGVYSRLLRRLLIGDDVAIRVPADRIPLRLRSGPLAWAERTRINARERLRWHVAGPLSARVGARRGGEA
ncbi:MAG TPA: hypothetical protein VEK39_00310 [Solirubrobacterales bacterium]|nr:hypothetical protein [Solirubrobacterales bacterium]